MQRVPPTERRGRVHTSTVTVAIIAESAAAAELSESEFKIEWYSGSGAGGQHRNKHQNSCRITHLPSGITKKAETRSRESSFREAMAAVTAAIAARNEDAAHYKVNVDRRSQIGSGMRGDKRRTYRFQDDSVVDHVTGKSSSCDKVIRGRFDLLWP